MSEITATKRNLAVSDKIRYRKLARTRGPKRWDSGTDEVCAFTWDDIPGGVYVRKLGRTCIVKYDNDAESEYYIAFTSDPRIVANELLTDLG